ncbi:hypothetical protein MMC34_003365 [Xylographa carneopallida]|nr:hypothetical protein [Xylographa carneopallida]
MHFLDSITVAILLIPSLSYARSIYSRDANDAQPYARDTEPASEVLDHNLHQRWAEPEPTIPGTAPEAKSAAPPAPETVKLPPPGKDNAPKAPSMAGPKAGPISPAKLGSVNPAAFPNERQKFREDAAIFGAKDQKFRQEKLAFDRAQHTLGTGYPASDKAQQDFAKDQLAYNKDRQAFDKEQDSFRQQGAARPDAGRAVRKPGDALGRSAGSPLVAARVQAGRPAAGEQQGLAGPTAPRVANPQAGAGKRGLRKRAKMGRREVWDLWSGW